MAETMTPLTLGTPEAAVRSCVSVIAAVTGQREEILAYWLDLYYQVRRAYEVDRGNEEDPRLIRCEDVYPALRELMRDALKTTARDAAKVRTTGKSRAIRNKPPQEKDAAGETETEGDGADKSALP